MPIDYYHLVFTIPEPLNAWVLQNKALFYRLLFETSAATLQTIAADPQHLSAQIGFFSILHTWASTPGPPHLGLHTWGQKLLFHPHIHCVATGGGISPDGQRWVACRPGFFLRVRVLSRLFLEALEKAFRKNKFQFYGQLLALSNPAAFLAILAPLRKIEWVVYAKPPFGGPARVLEYLGRYTHRVALTNRRLLAVSPPPD